MSKVISSYLSKLEEFFKKLPTDEIEKVVYRLEEARQKGQRVFVCGDGYSATTANDFATKLHKETVVSGKLAVDAVSLCAKVIEISAWVEDVGSDEVFVGMMEGKTRQGDLLIVISGRGNQGNVVKAVNRAKRLDATTIAFTGLGGGRLKDIVDTAIIVPDASEEEVEHVVLPLLCNLVIHALKNMPA